MLHQVKKIEKMSNYLNFVDEKKKSLNTNELADEYLSDFYDRNGIEELYEIDDAEY